MDKGKKRLVILDTHAILHRAFHAMPDFSSSKGVPTGALYGLISMLVRIASELEPDYIAAAFDLPKPTHRHLAYDKYKSHRPKTDDALVAQIEQSREVLKAFGIPLYEKEGFEADDCIGTIVEELKNNKQVDVVIASGDMDTLQLVMGEHVQVFMPKKGLSETMLYDEEAVVERYGFGPLLIPDYKGLRGDPSDNIPGVKGIGEKTATTLISTFGPIEDIYKALKKAPQKLAEAGVPAGMVEKLKAGEEDAEFSKMLAVIRRDAPINFTLPKETWRESAKLDDALDVLAQYEFRSLIPRVRELFAGNAQGDEVVPGDDLFAEEVEQVPEGEFAPIALAVSVLDSNIAEPDLEDIYRTGRSRVFE